MIHEHPNANESETSIGFNILFFSAIGIILIVAIIGIVFWVQIVVPKEGQTSGQGAGFDFHRGERVRLAAPVAGEAIAETTSVDLEPVITAINKGGCVACHTIPNIPGAVGQVGPDLSNIGLEGANRREGYTAEEYIRESLSEPSTFTAPNCPTGPCPPGTMPQILLDQAEIEIIVKYLVTLDTNQVSQTQ